jgi:uncharacterized protein (DUF1684 family)
MLPALSGSNMRRAYFATPMVSHDGILQPDEFAVLARQDRLFEMAGLAYFDSDGDGRISRAELIDKPNPAFALLDANHDCVITPEERRGGDSRSPGRRKRAG